MKNSWPPIHRRRHAGATGFTFLELLVIMAVILVLAAFTVANFGTTMKRAKLQGDATAISNSIQRARAIAVRRSKTLVMEIDQAALDLRFFFDEEDDPNDPAFLRFDAGIDELAMPSLALSTGTQPATSVRFWSRVDDDTPEPENAVDGFTDRTSLWPALVIEPDGSIRDLGGIRIGLGPDPSSDLYDGNFMEVRVVTAATGRTEIRKLIPGKNPPYEPRQQTSDGPNWKFY